MQLREFQKRAITHIEKYLELVRKEQKINNRHASRDAWDTIGMRDAEGTRVEYHPKRNPLDKDVPNFVLRIPTGGGKTLLAINVLGSINRVYKGSRTGLVLWVVPTDEIFRQTIRGLKDRNHPYRQHLDAASGGRTIIREKYKGRIDRFSPAEVAENLVVYVVMLQSAAANDIARKERKIFEDSGGFEGFFPAEDRYDEHEKLLKTFPNLDYFADNGRRVVKTSLANTIRTLEPVVVLDESQKAYTELGKKTILGFNPSIVVELSATPPQGSNALVQISGKELNNEEMIKLDMHVYRHRGGGWHTLLERSVAHLKSLDNEAVTHKGKTGVNIRPILLIQAERVGRDQRGSGHIHGDDVKEALLHMGIHDSEIAIKTGEKDELKQYEADGGLMSSKCPVRYIITKQALQEGWDCPFAYVLTVLARTTAHTALKQLVGRVLRQPYAKKTGVPALDESYVYVYHEESREVYEAISDGFKHEGLVDIVGGVHMEESGPRVPVREYKIQRQFFKVAKSMLLPFFFTKNGVWRRTNYEQDVLAAIPWSTVVRECTVSLVLHKNPVRVSSTRISISKDGTSVVSSRASSMRGDSAGFVCTPSMIADALADSIPNPWLAYEVAEREWKKLVAKHGESIVNKNADLILETVRVKAADLSEKYAREVFERKVDKGRVNLLVAQKSGWTFPSVKEAPTRHSQSYTLNLFERVADTDLNGLEATVADFLEDQKKLYFWYRNMSRKDYAVQGWRRERIYADFILALREDKSVGTVYVLETKGEHLAGNMDTKYKQDVFDLCTKYAQKAGAKKLRAIVGASEIEYKLVSESDWRKKLTEIFV